MRINLSLEQLEAFVELAAVLNFRAAAARLGMSQPALSRSIRLAEQTLGARLFDRDTRRVSITATGSELLPVARRILHDFDEALSELGEFIHGRSGQVTVAALPSTGVALLPRAIAAFRQRNPQVTFALLEASAEALLAAIENGRADFGLSVRPAPHQRLHYRHLHDDPFVLLCPKGHPLAKQTSASWSVFAAHPFIAAVPTSSVRPVTDTVFLQKRIAIRPTLEYPSAAACGALVAAGLGIAALPQMTLCLLDMQALAAVPLQRPVVARPIGIVTRIGRSLPPVSRTFLKTLSA